MNDSPEPTPPPAADAALVCCECGATVDVDYNVRDSKPYCFNCFYAEEGGD